MISVTSLVAKQLESLLENEKMLFPILQTHQL